jgi:hypothetical protein
MKKLLGFVAAFGMCAAPPLRAQFVVSDPMHTGVTTLIKLIQDPSFKSMVKNIEDLKRVASTVRQFHRGIETVSTVQKAVQKMAKLSAAVSRDGHIYPNEYALMTQDIEALAAAGSAIFKDMHTATTQSGGVLKMTDGERVNFLDNAYKRVSHFNSLIDRYFAKVRAMSIQRSGNKTDLANTVKLYNLASRVNTVGAGGEIYRNTRDLAYDMGYDDRDTSVLDKAYTNAEAKALREKQALCAENQANYYDELDLRESRVERDAFYYLISQGGYRFEYKKGSIKSDLNSLFTGGGQEQTNNTINLQTSIEESFKGFIDPNGKFISNEEFLLEVKIKSRELMRPIREELRAKWKLDECMTLGY